MIFNRRVMLPLTYIIFLRGMTRKSSSGLLRECRYTRLSRRLAAHGVTKIKMYASRTRGESTSGEAEACPINHPPLKISSSARLNLRERQADHTPSLQLVQRVLLRVSPKKSARQWQLQRGNSRALIFVRGETFTRDSSCVIFRINYFNESHLEKNETLFAVSRREPENLSCTPDCY